MEQWLCTTQLTVAAAIMAFLTLLSTGFVTVTFSLNAWLVLVGMTGGLTLILTCFKRRILAALTRCPQALIALSFFTLVISAMLWGLSPPQYIAMSSAIWLVIFFMKLDAHNPTTIDDTQDAQEKSPPA
ncbi:MAG: hypothetical protein ACRCWR_11005 [Saezia sp.]